MAVPLVVPNPFEHQYGGSKATNPGSTGGNSGGGIQRGTGPIIESLFSPDYMVDPNQSTNVLVQVPTYPTTGNQLGRQLAWSKWLPKETPTQAGPNINVPLISVRSIPVPTIASA